MAIYGNQYDCRICRVGCIRCNHGLDPTKKKPSEPAKNVAPAAAPVTAAAPVVANDEPVVAAITGAIVAMGYSSDQIASIRPASTSRNWRLDGRLSGRY